MELDLQVDLTGVDAELRDIDRRANDLRPVFRVIRRDVNEELKEHFERGEGPAGDWPAWSQATTEKFLGRLDSRGRRENVYNRGARAGQLNRRGMRRALNMLGRLKSAWDFQMDRTTLMATSRVPWSGVHQDGGKAGRGARVPARPFMWITQGLQARAASLIARYVAGERFYT